MVAYERMRLGDAVRRLDKAAGVFAKTQHRWIDSGEVAETLLTSALARLAAAHLAIRDPRGG